MDLQPALIPLDDPPAETVRAWSDLAKRAAEPNPFFEPQWLVPAGRYFGVPVVLLAIMEGKDMVACIPLFGHDRIRHLVTIPIWSVPSVLGTPLVDPSIIQPALASAVQFLSRRRGSRRLLSLNWLPTDAVTTAALNTAAAGRCPPWYQPTQVARPFLRRRSSATYLQGALNGKHRRALKWMRRSLERSLGQIQVRDRAGDESAIEQFLTMEQQGWKGRARTAMLGIPGRAQFFREMCANFANAGRLQLLTLEAGGRTLAMKCDVTAGEGIFSIKKTYNEGFGKFSPGVLLEVEGMRIFHEGDALWMDSCINSLTNCTDPLLRLWPDHQTFTNLVVTLDGIVGRVMMSHLAWSLASPNALVQRVLTRIRPIFTVR